MARIVVSRTMPVAHEKVWDAISDLGSHPSWMKDAKSIVFVGDRHRGKGTRMRVKTVIGPLRTDDIMEVVGWVEGTSIDVTHRGLVEGTGRLSVVADGSGSLVSWDEDLTFPWWLGGAVTAFLARPILTAVWRRNLGRLEDSLSSP